MSLVKTFKQEIDFLGRLKAIEYDLLFPINQNIDEITFEIINKYNLLDSSFEEIAGNLKKFINKAQNEEYCNKYEECNFNDFTGYWSELFRNECSEFMFNIPKFEEIINFSRNFNEFLTASRQNELINLVTVYRRDVEEYIKLRAKNLEQLQNEYREDFNSGRQTKDRLAEIYKEKMKNIKSCWNDQIIQLMKSQKNEFQEWVNKNSTNYQLEQSTNLIEPAPNASYVEPLSKLFSFKFGYQLKTTHNIKIVRKSVMSFFEVEYNEFYYQTILQNILSLYIENLSCLVLLADKEIPSNQSIEKAFRQCCSKSTELHFQFLVEQQDMIKNEFNFVKKENGHVYITIHSNLASVQVVFHLMTDLNVSDFSPSNNSIEVSGLKNIFDHCITYGIRTIYLPLLLTFEYDITMDSKWCLKRAESVLKCLKVILMDHIPVNLKDNLMNVNFLLPENIPEKIFYQICEMTDRLFTSSKSVVLTKNKL